MRPYNHSMLQVTSVLLYLFWGYIKSCVDKSRKMSDNRIFCNNVIFIKRLFYVNNKNWLFVMIDTYRYTEIREFIFIVSSFYNLFLNYTYNSCTSNIILCLSITKWLKICEFASWRNWRSAETCYFEVYDA